VIVARDYFRAYFDRQLSGQGDEGAPNDKGSERDDRDDNVRERDDSNDRDRDRSDRPDRVDDDD
jgi:hypothetical protein